jgi:hypothetical protein
MQSKRRTATTIKQRKGSNNDFSLVQANYEQQSLYYDNDTGRY